MAPLPDRTSLQDSVVVVTGGAQGIGYATAELAVAPGARVVIMDMQGERGAESASRLGAAFIELDVADDASVAAAAATLISNFGRIDVLINNAGYARAIAALDMTSQQFRDVLDVDLVGVFRVSREFAAHMIKRKSGSIVNVSSVSAIIASHPEPVTGYSAAKAGVSQLTRNLAADWSPFGIRVNSVSPGRVSTQMLLDNTDEATRAVMTQQTPLGRLVEASEIAEAILFLASRAASAVNGHDLVVDGGLVIV